MKILIVTNLFPPVVFGGYEILCSQVVEQLRLRGHQVEVLTSAFMADSAGAEPRVHRRLRLTTDFPRPGERVNQVDFSLASLHRVGRHNAGQMAEVLQNFAADVVFCWCLNRLGAGVILEAQRRGLPVYYTINDEHPRQFRFTRRARTARALARRLLERIYPMATFRRVADLNMTVISQALKDKLLGLQGPVEGARVIHQGVDLEKFAFAPTPRRQGEPLRLLYVGQLSRTKGVHTLLRSLGQLKFSFRLSVVGAGVPDYERHLSELTELLGVADRVTFTGKLPHCEVVRCYQNHHVLVFPSEWDEPFGLTHIEAMACGCAVVSTTTGGSAELIRHRRNALSFSAGDASQLSGRLRYLHDQEGRRWLMTLHARDYVEAHHSLRRYVDKLENWLVA